ncbi:MAG: lysoplasmalogenase [Myxococcales bacterium]|nr:lysoplasmalogenase [Myxococcales bacterium]
MIEVADAIAITAGAVAALDWLAVAKEWRRLEYGAKPLVMILLMTWVVVLRLGGGDRSTFGDLPWPLLGALAFSLVGDIFLMLPKDRFLLGLGAFFVAHLWLIVAFAALGDGDAGLGLLGAALVVALLLGTVGRSIVRGAAARSARLRGPVVAYMMVIAAMALVAFWTGRLPIVLGAVLFVTSDTILGFTRFVRPVAFGRVGVMITYHLAQGLFAWSAVLPPAT